MIGYSHDILLKAVEGWDASMILLLHIAWSVDIRLKLSLKDGSLVILIGPADLCSRGVPLSPFW